MPAPKGNQYAKGSDAGRPIEDLSTLPENWYVEVLVLYEQGASDVEIKAQIYKWRGSFSNDLWERWLIDYEEFSETIKIGRILSQSWWENAGRTNLKIQAFNYTGWYMNMKNRFKWKDNQQVDHLNNGEGFNIINLGSGVKPEEDERV